MAECDPVLQVLAYCCENLVDRDGHVGDLHFDGKDIVAVRKIISGAAMRPIADAPKDGTTFVSWDGKWWRRETRWGSHIGEHEGWHAFGFLPIKPTHWCLESEITPEIMKNIDEGNRPA